MRDAPAPRAAAVPEVVAVRSYGADRAGDVVTAWSTDLRMSLRKIAERALNEGEALEGMPRDWDRPGRPSRFRVVRSDS